MLKYRNNFLRYTGGGLLCLFVLDFCSCNSDFESRYGSYKQTDFIGVWWENDSAPSASFSLDSGGKIYYPETDVWGSWKISSDSLIIEASGDRYVDKIIGLHADTLILLSEWGETVLYRSD